MKFTIERDEISREIRFSGRITMHELADIRLDRMDRAVIGSPAETAADHLQSLEILYRRYGEQHGIAAGEGGRPVLD